MKHLLLIVLLLWLSPAVSGQDFITKSYTYSETENIVYGQQTDFAGNERTLLLDIFLPTNDMVPPCGRPLFVAVHGGAWMTGSKDDLTPTELCKDFAQRGYVAVSVNYRLGMFQTHNAVHCNLAGWDCFNAADSSEWIRALYRGMQDVKGAIRYMVKNAGTYQIDPRNVFVAGESAGGFIALSTGFMEVPAEKPADAGAMPAVLPPNSYAETNCVQAYGLDTSVASMNLTRPDLGPIEGLLHTDAPPYTLRGVGSFYGGMFQNLFLAQSGVPPALYLYHQPNDLLVPYKQGRLAQGYDYCAVTLGGCAYIQHLPYTWGGSGVATLLGSGGSPATPLRFDSTLNNADCATQLLNPATTGHAIDNFALRSNNLATFFAAQLETGGDCALSITEATKLENVWLYPNPASGKQLTVAGLDRNAGAVSLSLKSLSGEVMMTVTAAITKGNVTFSLPQHLPAGLYLLHVKEKSATHILRLSVP